MALKEVLPWAKPSYEAKAKAKRLAKLTELYLKSNNPNIKKSIDRMIRELKEG